LWRGIRLGGVSAIVLYVFSLLLPNLSFAHSSDQATRDLSAGAVLVAAVALVVLGTGIWLVLAGVISMFGARQITGDAIRLRTRGDPPAWYLAVDDGTTDHVRAFKVTPAIFDSLTEYSTVIVTLTPLLAHVRSVQRTTAAHVVPEPEPART